MCSVSRHWRSNLSLHPFLKTFGMILKGSLRPLTEHLSGQMLFPITPGNDRSKGSLSWMLPHLCFGSPKKQLEEYPQALQLCTDGTLPSLWPCRAEKECSMAFPTSVIQRSGSKIPPWTHSWEEKEISLCILFLFTEGCSPFHLPI